MASATPDAELVVPAASDTSPPPSASIAATAASSFALQAEIEASMEALLSPVCATDTSEETTEHEEAGTLLPSGEEEDAQDDEAGARDLDMLADTVRSIVTEVVGVEASVAEGGGEGGANAVSTETSHEADGNVAVETQTPNADDLSSNPGGGGDKSAQAVDVTDVLLPEMAQKVPQDAANEATVAVPTSNNPEVGTATGGNPSAKRPAVSEGKSNFPSKKQKRAEYSVETREICVRRHQTEGASYATISKELGIPHDTVRAIVRKAKRTGSVVSAPRSGRPRKTSGIVDKVILEAVRSNKQCSAKSIQEELLRVYGVKLSPETVRRRVLEHTKQRIQSISSGTSNDLAPSSMANNSATARNLVSEAPTAPPQGGLAAANTSLSDPVSFQQLLHGEGHTRLSGEHRISSSVSASGSATEVTSSAITSSRVPSSARASDVAMDHEGISQEQLAIQAPPDVEASTQKRQKRAEYSIEVREQCVSLHAQGQGYRRIGKALNMPHTTVRAIVEKAQRTGTVLPAKRSGRPRKTDAVVDKVILQAVKANEKSSARIIKEQLQAAYGVRVSCETIRRRVKDHSRQCMLASTLPNSVTNATLPQEETSQEQELLTASMSSSSLPAAALITFDENGVHL